MAALGEPGGPLRCAAGLPWLPMPQVYGAAVYGLQRAVEEAVEMEGPVLVQLRHQDVSQAVTPDVIVQPGVKLPRHRCHVVAVYLGPVQRQSHEVSEVVRQGEVPN